MTNNYTWHFSDAITQEYDLRQSLLRYPAPTAALLNSVTYDQLQTIKELEELACTKQGQKKAAVKARKILNETVWPNNLSKTEMDYEIFRKHFLSGVSGDIAFYYYIFDKCIPRGDRNASLSFMKRLATFAKASFRELWEEEQVWTIKDLVFSLEPNKQSSKKRALLPQRGEFAPDHKVANREDFIEEKPWHTTDIQQAFDKWGNPESCYNAKYLMVYCEANNNFYLYDWKNKHFWQMIPSSDFPGYPEGLDNF